MNSRPSRRKNNTQGDPWTPERPMGLGRALQKAGYGTRKVAEGIVSAGRVMVNGKLEKNPKSMVDRTSEIQLDGKTLCRVQKAYLALNKPARVSCTPQASDDGTVISSLLPPEIPGLRPVGRMDVRNTGLMLISNDKDWSTLVGECQHLEHEYRVQIEGELTELEAGVIGAGLNIPKMGTIKPLSVRIVEVLNGRTVLNIVLTRGKIRQLRRMFSTLRHKIVYLRRMRVGDVRLGNLGPGKSRELTGREVQSLRNLASHKPRSGAS